MVKKTKKISLVVLVFFLIVLVAAGCKKNSNDSSGIKAGGGEGIDDPSSVRLSSTISTVEAKDSSSRLINVASFSAETDYVKDKVDLWVKEDSGEALKIVNEIFCSVKQTNFGEMANLGPYRAQVDISQCKDSSDKQDEQSSSGSSSQQTSSSTNNPTYEMWVVDVTHEKTGAPLVVKFWIWDDSKQSRKMQRSRKGDEGGPGAMLIKAELNISESASDDNPIGRFNMLFSGYPIINGEATDVPGMKGIMYTEKTDDDGLVLKFSLKQEEGAFEWVQKLVLNRTGDTGEGIASFTSFDDCNCDPNEAGCACGGVKDISFAYNPSYVIAQDASDPNPKCLDRVNFHESVWSYGLYDATGTRVKRNSGFPIKYTDAAGKEYYGYVGYHGLWMPDEANLASGSLVEKMDWNNGNAVKEQYQVIVVDGKMIKHTKKTLTLADIKKIPLSWSNCDQTGCVEYRVIWNGVNLIKNGYRNEETNYMWKDTTPTIVTFTSTDWNFNFWSEALGGSGMIEIRDASNNIITPSGTTPIIFHIQNVMTPTDTVPTSLTCYNDCLNPAALTTTNPYFTSSWDPINIPAYPYTFADMLLKYNGTAVTLSGSNSTYSWGLHSGALFENTTANLNALKCDWDANYTCPWKAWTALDVYYTWETGPDNWNKFTTIKSVATGQYAIFEQPLSIKYTHSNLGSEFNGATFYLQYEGLGNLQGIPGICIDPATGTKADCGPNTHWVPMFSIPEGSTVIAADNSGTEYVVKGLKKEQRLKKVDVSVCTLEGLSPDVSYKYPDDKELKEPDVDDMPTVDAPPAVIAGITQTGLK